MLQTPRQSVSTAESGMSAKGQKQSFPIHQILASERLLSGAYQPLVGWQNPADFREALPRSVRPSI